MAEAVRVDVTHISHLETGSGTVSLKVFLAIVDHWLVDLVAGCDKTEIKIIADTVVSLKQTLRKNKTTE